jgi:hypothetical protein
MALSQANIEARMKPHFPGEQGKQLVAILVELNANIIAINTWGATLATKLNNDATVTDTNYASPNIATIGLG